MSNYVYESATLTGAMFSNGDTLSGTWVAEYTADAQTLVSVADVGITLTSPGGSSATFSSAHSNVSVDIHSSVPGFSSPGYTYGGYYYPGQSSSGAANFEFHAYNPSSSIIGSDGESFSGLYIDLPVGTTDPTGVVLSSPNTSYDYTSLEGSGTYLLTSSGVITSTVICFCAGTRLATPTGEVAVESLKEGDLVITANGAKPVRWLGRSDVSANFASPLHSAPIRIAAGALGENLPVRDLRVSPAHAIFLDGVLVQAGALVNGTSITREPIAADFSYYHVELESHELLLSEGLLTESFVDNVDRMNFSNWADRTAPETAIAEMAYPRVKSARQLPPHLRTAIAA